MHRVNLRLVVIKAILNPFATPCWSFIAILEETSAIFNSFVDWNACFVFRNSNFVAHPLTQWV